MGVISQQHQLMLETLHNKQYTRAGQVRKYQTRNLKQTLLAGMEIYYSEYNSPDSRIKNVNDPSVFDTLMLQNETDPRIVKFLERIRLHREQKQQEANELTQKLFGRSPRSEPTDTSQRSESIMKIINQRLKENKHGN